MNGDRTALELMSRYSSILKQMGNMLERNGWCRQIGPARECEIWSKHVRGHMIHRMSTAAAVRVEAITE